MGTMGWHGELLIGFDLETTGTDPAQARIVTAAVVETKGGVLLGSRHWLADPGVPIPAEAAAIHGITTEEAAARGRPAREVVEEIAAVLAGHWSMGVPVVAYNARFDLSLLAAELRRHGLPPLGEVGPVVDPFTIDRAVDRYRKGRRTLGATCAEYGVVLDGAHEAGADALAAVRVARAVAARYPEVAEADIRQLHADQRRWYAEWAAGYQAWLRGRGDVDAVVETGWPMS